MLSLSGTLAAASAGLFLKHSFLKKKNSALCMCLLMKNMIIKESGIINGCEALAHLNNDLPLLCHLYCKEGDVL